MEPDCSLPHSQVPTTCLYPEPAGSRPYPHIPLHVDPSYYYPLIYAWGLQVDSFPQVFPPNLFIFLISHFLATWPIHLILLDFITREIFGEQYSSLSSLFCSFLHSPVPPSLYVQIFFSTPYSQTSSAYVPPSMWATKFHTHNSNTQK